MTARLSARYPDTANASRRSLYGAAASLGAYILARLLANRFYPLDSYPFANQVFFLGTPFLALSFLIPGLSALGLVGANLINGLFWALLGAAIGRWVSRLWLAFCAWFLAAVLLAALVFAGLLMGMLSSSP